MSSKDVQNKKKRSFRSMSSREHKAKVELAAKRRELSKALKREGFDGVPLAKKIRSLEDDNRDEEKKKLQQQPVIQKTKEEREKERLTKLEERKKRSSLLLKRTRKGQPIMKNFINDLVNKISSSS
jgi:hypothetical protein